MTQNKARRTNKIDFLQLPWAQEASGSNPDAPTKNISLVFFYLLKAPFTSNPICGILAARRSGLASRLVSESLPHGEFAKTCGGRSAIQKVLNGAKLSARYLACMGKIQGTLRISRLISLDYWNCKSVITYQARLALHLCLSIVSSWLNLGSARSWRRFANFSCPVRVHTAERNKTTRRLCISS